jgi:hypothetical protein
MGPPQAPLHGDLTRVAHARGTKAMSGTRTRAQPRHAGDGVQPTLRFSFPPRLMPGVRQVKLYKYQCTGLNQHDRDAMQNGRES